MRKRSWKNILVDKTYQLRFTLVLVCIAGMLMASLGWLMYREARETTIIGENSLLGKDCREHVNTYNGEKTSRERRTTPAENGETTILLEPPTTNWEAGLGEEIAENKRKATEELSDVVWQRVRCESARERGLRELSERYRLILGILFFSFVGVLVALVIFSLRMTHRVVGPLYRMGVHMEDLVEGKYQKLLNIRETDLLGDFYQQFGAGYQGVERLDKEIEECIEELNALRKGGDRE